MTLLEKYIAAWSAHDVRAILATLHPDCVVIESFGPIYRGHACVERWVAQWRAEDGRVLDWQLHDVLAAGDREVAQWSFHYTWRGEEARFDGATVARLHEGRLIQLREYATTAPLFDWQGQWR